MNKFQFCKIEESMKGSRWRNQDEGIKMKEWRVNGIKMTESLTSF